MQILLVAAMSTNGAIGYQNKLPWHLPEELKYFKKITLGKPVLMGRSTFQSMGSKPLPDRHNIVMTREKDFLAQGCTVVHSVEEALKVVENCEEVMVIGGAEVYKQFLPLAKKLYLTVIHHPYEGDTFFPEVDWQQWEMISEQIHQDFTTKIFEKRM